MHLKRYLEKFGLYNPGSLPIDNFKQIVLKKLPLVFANKIK